MPISQGGQPFKDHEHQFYAGLNNMLFQRLGWANEPEDSGRLLLAFRYDDTTNLYEPVGKGVRSRETTQNGRRTYVTSWHSVKNRPSTEGGIGGLAKAVLENLELSEKQNAPRMIRDLSEALETPRTIRYGPQGAKYANLEMLTPDLSTAAAYIGVNDPKAPHIMHAHRE